MASSLTGIPRQAINSTGGIKEVYLATFQDVSGYTITSGVTSFASGVTIDNFVKFVPTKESSNLTETWTGSFATGQGSAEQVLTLVFHKQNKDFRNIMQTLATNELVAIVVDKNGNNVVIGGRNGLDLTSNAVTTGTGPQDLQGYTITLRGNEPELAGSLAAGFIV